MVVVHLTDDGRGIVERAPTVSVTVHELQVPLIPIPTSLLDGEVRNTRPLTSLNSLYQAMRCWNPQVFSASVADEALEVCSNRYFGLRIVYEWISHRFDKATPTITFPRADCDAFTVDLLAGISFTTATYPSDDARHRRTRRSRRAAQVMAGRHSGHASVLCRMDSSLRPVLTVDDTNMTESPPTAKQATINPAVVGKRKSQQSQSEDDNFYGPATVGGAGSPSKARR
ncbi:hypothetical protein AYO20_10947 [Fonsecaea nubica]|uniref:Uncharacterized protein n=1 Tax=Fonsecaea nubica TaxID=856822 RepID=A0A178C277_9EURO|nr:hypothetical protein AYO20_10947 [Fonsecaea nubica]OAL23697.1 hypothetical protein AYO20_10947 [Fonsecaea nubica]